MTLEYRVTAVPEGLESHYKSEGTGFVLDVKGVVDETSYNTLKTEAEDTKRKVTEFRETNINLRRQIEGASNTGTGDTSPPKIDVLVNDAVTAATEDMRAKIERIESERNQLSSQLEEVVLSDKVKDIAIKNGVFETALPDIVMRARAIFTVHDGKPIPLDKNSKDENGEMYSPSSWLKKLETDAPHLFKSSTGSGTRRPVNNGRGSNEPRSATDKIAAGLNMGNRAAKNVM